MALSILPIILHFGSLVGIFTIIIHDLQVISCCGVKYKRLNTSGMDISTSLICSDAFARSAIAAVVLCEQEASCMAVNTILESRGARHHQTCVCAAQPGIFRDGPLMVNNIFSVIFEDSADPGKIDCCQYVKLMSILCHTYMDNHDNV